MTAKSLYIFVDSERPDPYLNSTVFNILRREVRRVVFVHIQGVAGKEEHSLRSNGLSARVLAAVQEQLKRLSENAEYSTANKTDVAISPNSSFSKKEAECIKNYYSRCRNVSVSYSNEDIKYINLRDYIKNVARSGFDFYFDITAIKKRYIADIIALCLVEGIKELYSFEIVNVKLDFDHPWRMLVHELEKPSPQHFQYVNLLDTPVYLSCARFIPVITPRVRMAAGAILIFLLLGCAAYWYFGPQSPIVQTFMAISSLTGIASLVLGFIILRN